MTTAEATLTYEKRASDEIEATCPGAWERDRLQAYYRAHPDAFARSLDLLDKAAQLADSCREGAVVFSLCAVEVAMREAFQRPLLLDMVERMPVLDASAGTPGVRCRPLLTRRLAALADLVGLDLHAVVRPGAAIALEDEIRAVEELRDEVIHAGLAPRPGQAEHAVAVGTYVLRDLFGRLREQLGLDRGGAGIPRSFVDFEALD